MIGVASSTSRECELPYVAIRQMHVLQYLFERSLLHCGYLTVFDSILHPKDGVISSQQA